MGNQFSGQNNFIHTFLQRTQNSMKKKKYRKVLVLGLDSAGKTCLLYNFKTGQQINTIPTIGYNHEEVKYRSTIFSFWDLGGQDRIRTLWEPYFYRLHGIVFMVDSHDKERIGEARDLLKEIVKVARSTGTENAVFLILANKTDMPDAMNAEQLQTSLELNTLNEIHYTFMFCSVRIGTGMDDALEWLHKEMKRRFG